MTVHVWKCRSSSNDHCSRYEFPYHRIQVHLETLVLNWREWLEINHHLRNDSPMGSFSSGIKLSQTGDSGTSGNICTEKELTHEISLSKTYLSKKRKTALAWPHIIEPDLGVLHLTTLHLLLLDSRNLSFGPLPDLAVGTPLFCMVFLQVSSHTSSSWREEEYWDANMLEDLLILFFPPFLGAEPRDTEGFGQPSIWQRARRPWIVKYFQ